jgi:MFS family permease
MSNKKGFYGWRLIALAVFIIALATGAASHGLGVFFVALEKQFGWSRTVLSGAFALARLEGTVVGPLEGFLTDRFGSRRMVLFGYILLGLGFFIFSLSAGIYSFYIGFMVIAVGQGFGGFLPMIAAVNNWFIRRRSIAIALAGMGVYLGGVFVPALAVGINLISWRSMAVFIGIVFLILAYPITRLIKNKPEDYGELPDGDDHRIEEGTSASNNNERVIISIETDFTAKQAMKTPAFWFITFSHGLTAMVVGALQVHTIPMLHDAGLSLELAGTVVAIYTFLAMGSRVLGGYFGDRVQKPWLIFGFSMIQAVGVIAAIFIHDLFSALLFACLFGMGWGGRGALFTALRGDYFGRKAFATIFGLSAFFLSGTSVVAPLFAGFMFDTFGNYDIALFVFALINIFGATLVLLAKKPVLERYNAGVDPVNSI